jgi:hypothetical protein
MSKWQRDRIEPGIRQDIGLYPQLTDVELTPSDQIEMSMTDFPTPDPIPTRKSAGRKYRWSEKYQKRILCDEFDEPYFAHEKDDISIPVPLSLPQSLLDELDKKLDKIRNHKDINKRKEKLKRSRYIRQVLERDLGVIYREA